MILLRLVTYNVGYPFAAALLGISACGFILDIDRLLTGHPHPLILYFGIATAASGALFVLAQRRLVRSFRRRW